LNRVYEKGSPSHHETIPYGDGATIKKGRRARELPMQRDESETYAGDVTHQLHGGLWIRGL
jgi:hypothetical protein